MESSVLQLHFLGERRYLHGTTLFDALVPYCRNGNALDFRISRMIETDRVMAEPVDAAIGLQRRFHATLVWNEGGSQNGLGVVPLKPSPQPLREVFDEAAIVARAKWEAKAIMLSEPAEESLVRSVIALNKALLFRVLRPPKSGQWLFVRLQLDRVVSSFQILRVEHRLSVGLAAVSSAIEVDGEPMGTVVFSWLTK